MAVNPAPLKAEDLAFALPDQTPAEIEARIEQAWVLAIMHAPCLDDALLLADEGKQAVLRAILSRAIAYDVKAGERRLKGESVGPYNAQYETESGPRSSALLFSSDQVAALKELCGKTPDPVKTNGMTSLRVSSTMGGVHGYPWGDLERQYFSAPYWRR